MHSFAVRPITDHHTMQSGPYHTFRHTQTLCSFYLSFVFKTFVSTPKKKEVFPQNSDLSLSHLIISLCPVYAPLYLHSTLYLQHPSPYRTIANLCLAPFSHFSTLHWETISLLQNCTPQSHIGYTLRSPISTDLCCILGISTSNPK